MLLVAAAYGISFSGQVKQLVRLPHALTICTALLIPDSGYIL